MADISYISNCTPEELVDPIERCVSTTLKESFPSVTDEEFIGYAARVLATMRNPKYLQMERSDPDSAGSLTSLLKLLKGFKSYTTEDVDKTVKLKSTIEMFATESNFTMDGVDEYIGQLTALRDTKVCDKFGMNIDLINRLDEFGSSPTPVVLILKSFQCTTCECFLESHSACNKFAVLGDAYMCTTCGLQSDKHAVCDAFTASIGSADCDCCGRSLFAHRSKEREAGKCCDAYKKSDIDTECEHCSYSKGEHIYNDKYWQLNREGRYIVMANMCGMLACVMGKDIYKLYLVTYVNQEVYRSNWKEVMRSN
jgi:hypothetical protein